MADEIESVLKETRVFPPPPAFAEAANINAARLEELRKAAEADPDGFWRAQAAHIDWIRPFDQVLDWKLPFAKWFVGGQLNASANCLDRHLTGPRADKAALIFEGEPFDSRVITYRQLAREVNKAANALRHLGVDKGDRVAIYMPLIPEAVVAMLACARIGAIHSVVFGGFSAEALKDRINDAGATVLITADGGWRKGHIVPLKANVDAALELTQEVAHVVVVKRTAQGVPMKDGRDQWWHDLVGGESPHCDPVAMDSEDPLYILYTSGTTGKPKGVVHTTGGYMVWANRTTDWVFDLKEHDTYWCTADIGWVTGHTYTVYGPLSLGATAVIYEGGPMCPEPDRFWAIVEKHKVNVIYTAPTAIRAFIAQGDAWPAKHDLSTLRLLGTVGEPINPEAWMWYRKHIGGGRCPIVDTWWQTETGGILITPVPGVTPTKPGSATLPLPGVDAAVVDKEGNEVPLGSGGYLVITRPWPAMLRTVWGDPDRYREQYWSEIPGVYFTGDGARRDKDGYFWIMGRIDDVVNVAGHRLGTMEIESAIVSHPAIAEAAVVARPDPVRGTELIAFVTVEKSREPGAGLAGELQAHVEKEIGRIARPAEIRFTQALPKTRSGKIMRRLLRELATSGQVKGDTTTLEDLSVLERLRQQEED
jgi:acetyl-CoA synthetase